MSEPEKNGHYFSRFDKIDKELDEIKDDLSKAVHELSSAVTRLTDKLDAFIGVAQNSIPIKVVAWMFGILVLTIAGIEGVKALSKFYGLP